MRSSGAVVALLLLGLAGCAEDPADAPGAPRLPDGPTTGLADRATVVHGLDGRSLADAAFPGDLPAFTQRMIPGATAREPMVAATPEGVFYNSLQNHKTIVWHTADEGSAWALVQRHPLPTVLDGSAQYADPFLLADPDTGRLFAADMFSTDCILLEWSDAPVGGTWDWSTIGDCTQDTGEHDHQSIVAAHPRTVETSGYPNVLHYCTSSFDAAGDPMARCKASLDGGRTFGAWSETGLDFCSGLTGHLAAAPDGTVFLPQLACRGQDEDVEAWVAISRDDGQTWTPVLVDHRPASEGGTGVGHEGAIAIDSAGNVFYYYMDDRQLPRLSVSRDGGATWSPSRDVAAPGLTGCTFPSIVAGDTGRIALFCIGTTVAGGFAMANEIAGRATWHAYVTVSLDALASDPVFVTATVNDPADPLARGKPIGEEISVEALTAPVNSMGDFLKVTLDEGGRIWVALVDECTVACSDGGTQNSPRGYGYFPAAVGVQVAGASLRAQAAN
jgi:hypothetical protein